VTLKEMHDAAAAGAAEGAFRRGRQ
jgi:hypothetical protein